MFKTTPMFTPYNTPTHRQRDMLPIGRSYLVGITTGYSVEIMVIIMIRNCHKSMSMFVLSVLIDLTLRTNVTRQRAAQIRSRLNRGTTTALDMIRLNVKKTFIRHTEHFYTDIL